MRKKSIYITFFITIFSLIVIVPITSALTKTDTKEGQQNNEKGKITIKYTAPETDWNSATPEEKKILKEIGWELEDGILVQYRSIPEEIDQAVKEGFLPEDEEIEYQKDSTLESHNNHDDVEDDVIVNGEKTAINDGRFEVKGNPEEIEIESEEGKKEIIKRDKSGEYQLILEQNLNEILEDMDSHDNHESTDENNDNPPIQTLGYGDTYKKGDWVHCNRFNGPRSNNKHLKKTNPQALINFYKSDCDYGALRYCKSHKNCNLKQRAAYCSYKQGHSTKYHKH